MQSDFLDRKLYKMAEQEQMAISEDLDARVDDILQHLEKNGRGSRHHYSFRRAAILAAVKWGLKDDGIYCVATMLTALVGARLLTHGPQSSERIASPVTGSTMQVK